MGFLGLESRSEKENLKGSNYNLTIKLAAENPNTHFTVTNMAGDSSSVVQIHSSDMMKEYLLNEDSFQKGSFLPEAEDVFGLIFHTGEQFYQEKSLFLKIFRPEGLEVFTPKICKLIQTHVAKFESERGISTEKFSRIDISDLFTPIIEGITDLIIFGKEDLSFDQDIDDLRKLHQYQFKLLKENLMNPIVALFPFFARKLNLVPGLKEHGVTLEKQAKILERILAEREAKGELGQNIIDRIVQHNLDCKKTGNTKDIMNSMNVAGQYNLFYIAGSDTSQLTTKSSLCKMTTLPKM